MDKLKSIYLGAVNPPIYQTSTVAFETLGELAKAKKQYGRAGTETNDALSGLVANLESAAKTIVTSSGVAAITSILLSVLKQGDHILVCKSAYAPTHFFCEGILKNFGIETSYFDGKACGAEVEKLVQDNTKLIFLESPSSIIYEIQELDEIVSLAKQRNILTVIDNTWSAGVLSKPLELGIDVSLQSLSKYCSGHSDILLGSISFKDEELYQKIWPVFYQLGDHASPQDCYLAYRGIQTLEARLKAQQANALEIAKFLESRSEIKNVIHPGLDSFDQKERFEKYFTGSNGLITFAFADNVKEEQVKKFVDDLQYFKIGYSWGGYESLIMYYPQDSKSKDEAFVSGLVRVTIGLEDVKLLKDDLQNSIEGACQS